MRRLLVMLCIVGSTTCVGCGLIDMGKEITSSTMNIMRPNPRDYDDPDLYVDEGWSDYGIDARSEQPTDKLNDPIGKWTTSDKAKSIERSLGYEYK